MTDGTMTWPGCGANLVRADDKLMSDGENLAVRMFLAQYAGGSKPTTMSMRKHMTRAGYPFWPDWVSDTYDEHLTKSGAQSWLRYLFSLEQKGASHD